MQKLASTSSRGFLTATQAGSGNLYVYYLLCIYINIVHNQTLIYYLLLFPLSITLFCFPGETNPPTVTPTSSRPTFKPSHRPTSRPSGYPTGQPSQQPSTPTSQPTNGTAVAESNAEDSFISQYIYFFYAAGGIAFLCLCYVLTVLGDYAYRLHIKPCMKSRQTKSGRAKVYAAPDNEDRPVDEDGGDEDGDTNDDDDGDDDFSTFDGKARLLCAYSMHKYAYMCLHMLIYVCLHVLTCGNLRMLTCICIHTLLYFQVMATNATMLAKRALSTSPELEIALSTKPTTTRTTTTVRAMVMVEMAVTMTSSRRAVSTSALLAEARLSTVAALSSRYCSSSSSRGSSSSSSSSRARRRRIAFLKARTVCTAAVSSGGVLRLARVPVLPVLHNR